LAIPILSVLLREPCLRLAGYCVSCQPTCVVADDAHMTLLYRPRLRAHFNYSMSEKQQSEKQQNIIIR